MKHEQKEWGKKAVPLLLSCSLTVQASNFDVTSLCFPLDCVMCSFYSADLSHEQIVCCRKCPNFSQRSSPLLFSGPLKAPWVLFPSVCVQCCAFLTCDVHSCSPLLTCLLYLKKEGVKKMEAWTWGEMFNAASACFNLLVAQWETSQMNPMSDPLFEVLC